MTDSTFGNQQSDFRLEGDIGDDDMDPIQTAVAPNPSDGPDRGPCLYLGPAGQRCYRRALKDGFCAQHQPGALATRKIGKPSKFLAAIAGILGVLWPYVYDFLHELFRLIHPH
ncbi:MAG: hypothetical protein ACRD4R_04965 [Candidatus Acidiferrales bacterium]